MSLKPVPDPTPEEAPAAAPEPNNGVKGHEVRDLAVAFMNAASEHVPPSRQGGALLVTLALMRATATIAVGNGFPRVPLFRMLANEIEMAEQIQSAAALAASQKEVEAS